ncbi:uncharacterized protein UTRI_02179 [Ustilago trichophora]|uniref:Uncharacterized protein n=1 Tax=Ustilago trichophora TaxID=86804 RepID=A0A5C3E0L1_9BASI|nr:uncharacterized protein UTRI_02179 [Ustilago trichophora]
MKSKKKQLKLSGRQTLERARSRGASEDERKQGREDGRKKARGKDQGGGKRERDRERDEEEQESRTGARSEESAAECRRTHRTKSRMQVEDRKAPDGTQVTNEEERPERRVGLSERERRNECCGEERPSGTTRAMTRNTNRHTHAQAKVWSRLALSLEGQRNGTDKAKGFNANDVVRVRRGQQMSKANEGAQGGGRKN